MRENILVKAERHSLKCEQHSTRHIIRQFPCRVYPYIVIDTIFWPKMKNKRIEKLINIHFLTEITFITTWQSQGCPKKKVGVNSARELSDYVPR